MDIHGVKSLVTEFDPDFFVKVNELTVQLFQSDLKTSQFKGMKEDLNIQDWLSLRNFDQKKTLSAHRISKQKGIVDKMITRLVPDWERRRRLGDLRLLTLFKIYLSKWFYKGLMWYEVELLIQLRSRLKHLNHLGFPELSIKELTGRRGFVVIFEKLLQDELNVVFDAKGQELLEIGVLSNYIYSEVDFKSIWNLRSFQKIKDFIFQVFDPSSEHEGINHVNKPRVRGHRDGKGNSSDEKRIKLSLKIDSTFYSEEFEERFKNDWEELLKFANT
jgi:hypothetical protein